MKQDAENILYVITKANWGGAQRYVYDLAMHSHASGRKVLVVHGQNEFKAASVFLDTLAAANIPTHELVQLGRDVRLLSDAKVFFELVRLFRKEKPQIVHLNSSKIGGLGALAARLAGVPNIVYTAHGLPHFEDRPWWQQKVIAFITWMTFVLAHHVIVLSDREKKAVTAWPYVRSKVHRIYNGVTPMDFFDREAARETLAKKINHSLSEIDVLMGIGELTSNKGLSYLLDALALLKQERDDFVYVHWGTGELSTALQQHTKELGLENTVFWLGFDREAARYLGVCDVFVLPSLKEGLPYVLLEAGLAGCAVVATDVGGVSEIITDTETGYLIQPKAPTVTAQTISALLGDAAERRRMGQALQKHVTERFSAAVHFKKIDAVYTT